MIKVELTEEQLQALYQIVNRTSISGADAEMIVGLKQVLAKAAEEKKK